MINRFQQYITEQKNIGIKQYFYDLLDEYGSDQFKYHLFNLKDNHYCIGLYCGPLVKHEFILNVIDRINSSNEFEVNTDLVRYNGIYYYLFDSELVKKYLPVLKELTKDGEIINPLIPYNSKLFSKFEHEFGVLIGLNSPFVSCLLKEASK